MIHIEKKSDLENKVILRMKDNFMVYGKLDHILEGYIKGL